MLNNNYRLFDQNLQRKLLKEMISPLSSPLLIVDLPRFVQPVKFPTEKEPILQSDFKINEPLNESFHVILFEEHIEINSKQTGRFRIPFNFQNKFSIEGSRLLLLSDDDQELGLNFTRHQMEIWRKQLDKKLCQRFQSVPFRIKKRISVRNLCAIYLAQEDLMEKGVVATLAVKAFRKTTLGSGKVFEDFKNEMRIMRNIHHPNLCRLQHVYESDNSYYICMPHYEGGTLLERHLREPLSIMSVKNAIQQILAGVSYLHKKGITHRDIKPENILMRKTGAIDLVIIDFGLSASFLENSILDLKCGTPGYVAPEIFKSSEKSPYNEKCDIFSIGILFFWLLTQKLPYSARTQKQLKIQNYTINFDSKKYKQLDSCPSQAVDLLQSMLKRDPKSRISAQEALKHPWLKGIKQRSFGAKHIPYEKEQQCKYDL